MSTEAIVRLEDAAEPSEPRPATASQDQSLNSEAQEKYSSVNSSRTSLQQQQPGSNRNISDQSNNTLKNSNVATTLNAAKLPAANASVQDLIPNNAAIVYENTFKMKPDKKFASEAVKRVVDELLSAKLVKVTYDPESAGELTKAIADEILQAVKKFDVERYKFVVDVTIGEFKGQGIRVASRCVWDTSTDSYSSSYFRNSMIERLPDSPTLSATKPPITAQAIPEFNQHPVLLALDNPAFGDIKSLLVSNTYILALPIKEAVNDKINHDFFEHHVYVVNPENPIQLLSLTGVRALISANDLLIIGPTPPEEDLLRLWALLPKDVSKKRSLWDTFSHISLKANYPSVAILKQKSTYVIPSSAESIDVYIVKNSISNLDMKPLKPPIIGKNLSFLPILRPSLSKSSIESNLPDIPLLLSHPAYAYFTMNIGKNRLLYGDFTKFLSSFVSFVGVDAQAAALISFTESFTSRLRISFANDQVMIDGMELYLYASLYQISFQNVVLAAEKMDLLLHWKMSCLNVSPNFAVNELASLSTSNSMHPEYLQAMVQTAGMELLKVDNQQTPMQKLDMLSRFHQLVISKISDSLGEGDDSTTCSSADILFPILLYIVVKVNPPRLASNLTYTSKFSQSINIDGYSSYCLTNLTAVASYLENCDLRLFGISEDLLAGPLIFSATAVASLVQSGPASDHIGTNVLNNIGSSINNVGSSIFQLLPSFYGPANFTRPPLPPRRSSIEPIDATKGFSAEDFRDKLFRTR